MFNAGHAFTFLPTIPGSLVSVIYIYIYARATVPHLSFQPADHCQSPGRRLIRFDRLIYPLRPPRSLRVVTSARCTARATVLSLVGDHDDDDDEVKFLIRGRKQNANTL